MKPLNHDKILKYLTNVAKVSDVDTFEEVINYQYQKIIENEKDPNFLKSVKNRNKSIINKATKEQLQKLDFNPGDELIMKVYLKQN